MNPVKLSREEIKKVVYGLHGKLDEDQRALIAETLGTLMHQHDQVGPDDLHKALRHLREASRISESEEKAIVSAVFG